MSIFCFRFFRFFCVIILIRKRTTKIILHNKETAKWNMKLTTARSSVSVPKPAAAPQSATSSAARTLNPCLGKTQAPQRAAATGRQREWEREGDNEAGKGAWRQPMAYRLFLAPNQKRDEYCAKASPHCTSPRALFSCISCICNCNCNWLCHCFFLLALAAVAAAIDTPPAAR